MALAVFAAGARRAAVGVDQTFVTCAVVQIARRSSGPAIRGRRALRALGAGRIADRPAGDRGTIRGYLTTDAHAGARHADWRVTGAVGVRRAFRLTLRVSREAGLPGATASSWSTFATLPEHARGSAGVLAVGVGDAIRATKVRGATVDALGADGATRATATRINSVRRAAARGREHRQGNCQQCKRQYPRNQGSLGELSRSHPAIMPSRSPAHEQISAVFPGDQNLESPIPPTP